MTTNETTQNVNGTTVEATATAQTAQPTSQASTAQPNVPKTYDEVVAALRADSNNKDLMVTIASVQLDQRTGKTGREYWNLFLTLDKPIIGVTKDVNGNYIPAYIRSIQMPYWQLELTMRGNQFFGRFIQYIADAIEAGFGDQFIAGLSMNLIAEFVPAGVEKFNPFQRKQNSYGIKDYDRYIYHVVAINKPEDELLVAAYRDAVADTRDMMREAMKARRAAKVARANVLASASTTESDDVPF